MKFRLLARSADIPP